jgi:hypothetical protein
MAARGTSRRTTVTRRSDRPRRSKWERTEAEEQTFLLAVLRNQPPLIPVRFPDQFSLVTSAPIAG